MAGATPQSFEQLQAGLAQWSAQPTDRGGTIVAVPSLSLPYFGNPTGKGLVHYEERIFYLAHFLKNPRNKLIIITSSAVAETLVSYLLHLLPGVPHSHARRRLQLFSLGDHSPVPLTQKILDRPRLLDRLRQLVRGEERATLSCYTVTDLEVRLAETLQIPVYGPRPEHLKLATKSIARNIFRDLEMDVAEGAEHLSSLNDVAGALSALARSHPCLQRAVLKHNYALAGLGNALVDLSPLHSRLQGESSDSAELFAWIEERLPEWVELPGDQPDWNSYWHRFQTGGGALEAFVEGDPCSVQVRVGGAGEVDILATHDELVGERGGQTYVASRMPAHPRVARALAQAGVKVGERLAGLGVVGRFDVDFLASPGGDGPLERLVPLDINLRKAHTTLPIRTLQLLSGGTYDAESGVFRSGVSGQTLCYRSSDHFGGGQLAGMLPRDLLEILSGAGMHYSSASQTGALFHMLGAMSERGKVGITAIAGSHPEADQICEGVLSTLLAQRHGYQWLT